MTEFAEHVAELIASIPKGYVASYGLIAIQAGRPRGARLVGFMMHSLKADLPFHRVVFQDGSICQGDPFGHPDVQRGMLIDEGVCFLVDGRVDMTKSAWDGNILL